MAVYTNTLADMITDFGYLAGETDVNNTRWMQPARIRLLNLAQLNVAEATRCIEEEWSSSVAAYTNDGDEIVTLDASCFDDGIIQIYWVDSDSNYYTLSERHPTFSTVQNDSTGTPSQFFRIGRNIHLMDKPDADGTVKIIGQRLPDELVNTTDASLIPAAYRHAVVLGAVKMAFREDDEYGKSDRTEMEYQELVRRLKKYAKKRRSVRGSKFVLPYSL